MHGIVSSMRPTILIRSIAVKTAILGLAASAQAAYEFDGLTSTINEDFNSLPTISIAGVFSATLGVQVGISGTQFAGTKTGGTGTGATGLTADNGNANSGGIYSYGATSNSERALGMVASGSNVMTIGFELENTSAATTITQLQIAYTAEFWRSSTSTLNILQASYGTTDGGALSSTFLTGTGFTDVDALDLTGPAFVAGNGPLDGNLPANQAAYSFTITGLSIDPGESFFFRWADTNDIGNDAGLAVDNLSIAVNVPEPTTVVSLLGGLGILVGFRRARRFSN